eukprot:ANDGO_02436.mRNA.1 hypothetical protein
MDTAKAEFALQNTAEGLRERPAVEILLPHALVAVEILENRGGLRKKDRCCGQKTNSGKLLALLAQTAAAFCLLTGCRAKAVLQTYHAVLLVCLEGLAG